MSIQTKRLPSRVRCTHAGCSKMARRIYSTSVQINAQPCSSQFPYVSYRLPPNLPGCRTANKAGHVIIENAAHKDRIFKKHEFVRECGTRT